MKSDMTLTRRFVLYVAGIISVLLISSLMVTSAVVRSAFTDQFSQHLSRSRQTLARYSEVHELQAVQKLRTVLTSPRFLAAVATKHTETIQREMPIYEGILGAEFLAIRDRDRELVYSTENINKEYKRQLNALPGTNTASVIVEYFNINQNLVEIVCSDIYTNDGFFLGQLLFGSSISRALTTELKELTGFDVFISKDGKVLGQTKSRLTQIINANKDFFDSEHIIMHEISEAVIEGEKIISLSLPSSYTNATITFAGSVDEHIAPIMSQVTLWLIGLTVFGGVISLLSIYTLTKHRIERQIDILVTAAERIAVGDMEFEVVPQSTDELGLLAGRFEQMRLRLISNREALEIAHREKLNSERLATTGSFVAGIIHDLKNPLAIIKSSTELLQLIFKDHQNALKHCFNINNQIDRMVSLTRDILEYCRGKTRLEMQQIRLAEYFDELIGFHRQNFKKAGITIDCSGERDVFVNLDRQRFRRVIDNILNNAKEALKPGDKVVVKWAKLTDKLRIEISDNGPGIPEEIVDKLFDPFVTIGKVGGTGLGLAITKKIVEDHGSEIYVESEPGKGTTFTIDIPVQLVDQAASGKLVIS
ncbi:MAG: HAMP domain-containing histidine kinase [candidate division Zixibacteria bacterium]|nr:HAMP domain-containing histidine kinase [candidate division Zixibacteria bacterium]